MQTSSVRSRPARAPLLAFLALGGCVLAPEGYDSERARADLAGEAYAAPFAERALPELGACPSWRDVLRRAFLASGDLEAAYFAWRAALERVESAAGWPNTALMPSFGYLFSDESMTAWDRSTVSLAFDPSENLQLPVKTRKAAEVALAEARAAGADFRAAKFALQRRVLDAWLDLVLTQEELRLADADLELARALAATSAARQQAGASQGALLEAALAAQRAEDRSSSLAAELRARRASLNGLLARAPEAPLEVAELALPLHALPADDLALLALGVHDNPHLAGLLERVAGRENALELARLMYLPDLNPFAALTGGVSRMVGFAVMLPTTLPEIRAGIAEARARLAEAQALARQTHQDHTAHLVATLIVLRDSERRARLFEEQVLPTAQLLLTGARQAYAAGRLEIPEMIAAERAVLDVRLLIAASRVERERRVLELEELTGNDLETLDLTQEEPHAG